MITIYHNPKCSKSRETLKLLEENGITPEIIEYLNVPLGVEALERILDMLGCEPVDIIRKGEPVYKELGFHLHSPSRDELIEAMATHPILIERPIVVRGKKAVIGRPPGKVLDLL